MLLLDSFIDDVCGCDMQSLVSVHAWCLCILSGVPNSLLFSVITSRCLHSNASPAGFWPSLLRACGNTPPLIKFMSVEIATFNHFNILGTKEMLFPPSGGLESIKAALSVKISTVLGGRFFSPSPPPLKELLLQSSACKGRPVLQTTWHVLCSFRALCKTPASENQFNLLPFGEGVPVLASHRTSLALCNGSWRIDCVTVAIVILAFTPSPACWDWEAVWMPD